MSRHDIIIGIDPDCTKSGVAKLRSFPGGHDLVLHAYTFPELVEYLREMKMSAADASLSLLVVVEASWGTTTNWHGSYGDSRRVSSRKGYDVGRNHETGRKIVEMCKGYLGIKVKCRHPLRKMWKGKDGKITHDELSALLEGSGVRCSKNRTNQEERDAALLALDESGIPMRMRRTEK